jgi:hypothetical protein
MRTKYMPILPHRRAGSELTIMLVGNSGSKLVGTLAGDESANRDERIQSDSLAVSRAD